MHHYPNQGILSIFKLNSALPQSGNPTHFKSESGQKAANSLRTSVPRKIQSSSKKASSQFQPLSPAPSMNDLGSALPGKFGMASASQATGKRSYAEMVRSMPSVLATGAFAQPKAHTPGMVPSGHATVPPQPLTSTPQPREGQKIKKQKSKDRRYPSRSSTDVQAS
jgi:hypothetical protein